jgi:hypothetical protein
MLADKNERLKYMSDLSDILMVQNHVVNLVMPHLEQVMDMI